MGSSKKHKDKDREHKRKHRHRSRSRSRSRERRHRDREDRDGRHRDRDENESGRKRHRRDYSDDEHAPAIKAEKVENVPVEPAGGAADLSLSIEDTNKLRAKLGLKPLDVPDGKVKEEGGASSKDDEDVHVPAVNLSEVRRTEDLRLKMLQIREKRMINKKLGKVKTLGESDSEEEDTVAWVRKNRKIQKEREMAEKRAKLLEEMDEEFGVSGLVEQEFGSKKEQNYTSKDLKGIKVEHDQETFKEGQSVILTLKDKAILDEDNSDILVNYNMLDNEAAAKNVENKKKRPDYKPYDEPQYDEYGMLKHQEILDKYDEEIHGAKKESFVLGQGGKYDSEHEKRMMEIRLSIQQQSQTLSLAPPALASEYYTEEDMATFKKVKKKVRKIRKKKAVTADDLIPIGKTASADHGVRRRIKTEEAVLDQEDEYLYGETVEKPELPESEDTNPHNDMAEDMDIDDDIEDAEILGPEEDLTGVNVEDEAGQELELALKVARKLKTKNLNAPEKVAEKVLQLPKEEEEDSSNPVNTSNMVLNSTSEFCRALGDIPNYSQYGGKDEEHDDILDFERELIEDRKLHGEDVDPNTGWTSVDIDTTPVDIQGEEANFLDEETVVDSGIAAALQMAVNKGFLEQEAEKKVGSTRRNYKLEAQNYSIEDKRYDDLDEKYKKRDRYVGGMSMDFKDKSNYKPEVRLEYVDDNGRFLSPKEAFRQLSHRFHGKGSGKKKTEKRNKKVEEEMMMRQMSSTDTPLNTVSLFREKQRVEKSPYIILSGGSKGMTAATISKPN